MKSIPLFKVGMSPEAHMAVGQVLESGMIGEGPKCKEFQRRLGNVWKQNPESITLLNSCTSAITLALRLCNLDKRQAQTVISPTYTMIATNTAVADSGCKIPFYGTLNRVIDCKINSTPYGWDRPGAIIITLVGGAVPECFDEILEWAAVNDIQVILDAAHAYGTWYKGKHISHYGDYVCFSFQSIKHLTTGDGGALVCNNLYNNKRAQRLKWFGLERQKDRLKGQMEYQPPEWGYKFHMNDIAACIGIANMDVADANIMKSRMNTSYLEKLLIGSPCKITTRDMAPDCLSSDWITGVTCSVNTTKAVLAKHGIGSSTMWQENNKYSCFKDIGHSILITMETRPGTLYVPTGFWVEQEDIELIAKIIKETTSD